MRMKRIDTKKLAIEIYNRPGTFEHFIYDRFGDYEEIRMLCYLCDNRPTVQADVMEYIMMFNVRLEGLGTDTQKGYMAQRELENLKEYVYLCCEDELSLLVKYVNPDFSICDSQELTPGELYQVLKIDGDNFVIIDDSGEDWSYPSYMFEVLYCGGTSAKVPSIKCEEAKRYLKEDAIGFALSSAASALELSYNGDEGIIHSRCVDVFVEVCNELKTKINKECENGKRENY